MKKHSVKLFGHVTSVTLEPEFWEALKVIAEKEKRTLQSVIESVDENRSSGLSGALRVYVLKFYQKATVNVPENN